MLTLPGSSRTHSGATRPAAAPKIARARRPAVHLHWFYRVGDDAFSGSSLYACRCGMVRPGF